VLVSGPSGARRPPGTAARAADPKAWQARFFDVAPAPASLSRASDGRFVEVNEAFLHLYGYSRSEVIGRTSRELGMWPVPSQREDVAELVAAVGAVHSLEIDSRMKNGDVRRLLLSAELVQAEELCFLAVLQDATEQHRARADVERLAAELQRSNAELETFALVAAHDLQAPLRNIAAFVGLLREEAPGGLSAEARGLLARIEQESTRMSDLVRRLLQSSRVERAALHRSEVSLARLAREVVGTFATTIEATGASVTVDDRLPTLHVDEVQIREVLQNLVENALKFRVPGRPPEVSITAERGEGAWTITVRDNGIGIDASQAAGLFRMFVRFQPEERYSGSGIGLALARRIVERHGGRIWAEPAPGGGSMFRFTLPDA
jgi:PAS domain S-box-containing protein